MASFLHAFTNPRVGNAILHPSLLSDYLRAVVQIQRDDAMQVVEDDHITLNADFPFSVDDSSVEGTQAGSVIDPIDFSLHNSLVSKDERIEGEYQKSQRKQVLEGERMDGIEEERKRRLSILNSEVSARTGISSGRVTPVEAEESPSLHQAINAR